MTDNKPKLCRSCGIDLLGDPTTSQTRWWTSFRVRGIPYCKVCWGKLRSWYGARLKARRKGVEFSTPRPFQPKYTHRDGANPPTPQS